jgi:hypothetical protein
VRDYLAQNHGGSFDAAFGKGNGKAIMHATAGSIIGIGEIVILPLDVLKIKRQTNPEAFRGRGLIAIIRDEGFGLYRGWGWTAARNAPGSFAVSKRIRVHEYGCLTCYIAIWRFGCCQRVLLQTPGLQCCQLESELRRLDCWCHRISPRLCPSRRH